MTTPVAVEVPAGLSDVHEFPIEQIPDTPHWSENYWFIANAPESEMSMFLHCGRAPHARIWREIVIVCLPSGEMLISKAFGNAANDRGPSASALRFECVEPWSRWRVRFDGAGRRVRPGTLDTGMFTDGPWQPVSIDITFDGISPPWVLDEETMAAQDWGDLHYQQMLRADGTITYDDTRLPFVGTAVRDHTRGPRDFLSAIRHVTANCHFPSGKGFFIFEAASDHGLMSVASVLHEGRLHDAKLVEAPLLDSEHDAWRPYRIKLEWEGGTANVQAEILQPILMGLAGYNELTIGYDNALAYCRLFEAHSRFTWDGEVGHGWTERTLREHRCR